VALQQPSKYLSVQKSSAVVGTICVILGLAYLTFNRSSHESNERQIDELYQSYRGEFPDVREVSWNELLAWKAQKDIVIVDVRSTTERAVSMIPDAISIDEFDADRESFRNQIIVAYCTIGYRSGLFAKSLTSAGFHIYNLKGGVLAWASGGQLFSNQQGPTREVHVFGKKWNLLPKTYKAVW
jgi:rhodanese-related sulfurtransferase